ncbi:MAG: hypothetical protein IJ210_09820 [Clostridia bacterium]|nr:hypothetical protein [Clostridia bacterium]
MTRTKIRIPDDRELRVQLDQAYETASQTELCRYARVLSAHILQWMEDAGLMHDPVHDEIIRQAFRTQEQWMAGEARMTDVRQVSFRIHQMARASGNPAVCAALRVVGHAVACAHMREHAMVASDYAVKVISLLHPDCMESVREERLWQIHHLQEVKSTNE